jgi:cytochrome c oxidase subunit 3
LSFLQKIMSKPWEHAGELEGLHGEDIVTGTAGRTGLFMFLAVVSSFFGLFMITYYTRSRFPDWEMLSDPDILWWNTAALVLASVAMQLASQAAQSSNDSRARNALIAGSLLTLIFIGGQWLAWEQLTAAGYFARANPANAFFYLFTGLHALHLAGGLWFLLRAGLRMRKVENRHSVRQSITLCATYWHYLLLVWVVLFALLLRT